MQNNKMRPSKSQKGKKDKVRFYQRLFERVLPRAARGLRLISLLLFMVSGQHIHTKIVTLKTNNGKSLCSCFFIFSTICKLCYISFHFAWGKCLVFERFLITEPAG